MTFPTGLFVDAPELTDASMTQLNEDPAAWPEELTMKVKERVPMVSNMSIIIKFMKKDDELGTATGSIIISNPQTQVVVPVIIKDHMLYPLDVFIAKGKLLPLNQEYFGAIFNEEQQPFQNLEEYPNYGGLGRFDDGNLWNTVYPPSLGRYAYASANYDVINSIHDTIRPKDIESARDAEKVAWAKLALNHKELMSKLSHLQSVNMNEFAQSKDNLTNRNIFLLKREGPHKATILANYDDVFSPVIKRINTNTEEYAKFKVAICDKADDDINDVDLNGEKFVYVPSRKDLELDSSVSGPYMPHPVNEPVEIASEYDHYVVKKRDGVEVEGVVIPHVIDFDMQITDVKIFLGKTMSTVQPEIAGVRVKNSRFKIENHSMQPGQTGTLVYQKNPSKALATVPFTVVSIMEHEGIIKVRAQDLMGVGFKIHFTDMQLERIANMGDFYMVPRKMFKWMPMEGFYEVSNSLLDWGVKTAGVNVLSTGHGQFAIKGVDKYASVLGWDTSNLTKNQAMFLLTSLGAEKNAARKCLSRVGDYGNGQEKLAVKAVPFEEAKKVSPWVEKIANKFKVNLLKVANYVENTQSVDALLSLNFINPDNIQKFVSKIPVFKATISNLASLLIASRLGIKELPEESITTGMNKLVEVVNGLETLRATYESQQ